VPSVFWETWGDVVPEAWSQGVPMLVSDPGALPELVADGGGMVCESPAAFAEHVDHG
jgi:glycosyltransferase involved in cell wall biosynthesis